MNYIEMENESARSISIGVPIQLDNVSDRFEGSYTFLICYS